MTYQWLLVLSFKGIQGRMDLGVTWGDVSATYTLIFIYISYSNDLD